MKLVMTIVSNKDSEKVLSVLSQNGYFATKVSTTGQFLVGGHSAILIGCKDEEVEKLYELLKANITKRVVKTPGVTSTVSGSLPETDPAQSGSRCRGIRRSCFYYKCRGF